MAVIEFVTGYLQRKAVDQCFSLFRTNVIERWSQRRAEEFVETFCNAIAAGRDEAQVSSYLDDLMNCDQKSSALFDAYRRVSLSASPIVGPRIIALLTAEIVNEEREPTSNDSRLLAVAECMSDSDFTEAKDWYDRYVKTKIDPSKGFFDRGEEEESADTCLWDGWGAWAAKLQQAGFIQLSVRLIPNHNIHEDQSMFPPKLATDMYYDPQYGVLIDLVERATPTGE